MHELLVLLDIRVLHWVRLAVEWCVEWIGITQRWIERGLIVAYAVCVAMNHVLDTTAPRWLVTLSWISLVWMTGVMVYDHRRASRARARRLLSGANSTFRLFLLVLTVVCAPRLLIAPFRLQAVCGTGADLAVMLAFYVMAWPQGGEPGRKRRAAVAAWKDSFGRQWMPEGVKA